MFQKDPKRAAHNYKEREPVVVNAEMPTMQDNKIEVRLMNGWKWHIHCELCNGEVEKNGELIGGYLPYTYVSQRGNVVEALVFCRCKIGTYRAETHKAHGRRVKYYDELEDGMFNCEAKTFFDVLTYLRERAVQLRAAMEEQKPDADDSDIPF